MKKLIIFLLVAMTVVAPARSYKNLGKSEITQLGKDSFLYTLDGRRLLDTIDEEGEDHYIIKTLRKSSSKVVADFTLTDFDEVKGEATVRGGKYTVMITKAIWDKYQEAGAGNKYFEVWIIKTGDKLGLGIKGLHEEKK